MPGRQRQGGGGGGRPEECLANKDEFVVNAKLIDEDSPVAYIVTSLSLPGRYSRAREDESPDQIAVESYHIYASRLYEEFESAVVDDGHHVGHHVDSGRHGRHDEEFVYENFAITAVNASKRSLSRSVSPYSRKRQSTLLTDNSTPSPPTCLSPPPVSSAGDCLPSSPTRRFHQATRNISPDYLPPSSNDYEYFTESGRFPGDPGRSAEVFSHTSAHTDTTGDFFSHNRSLSWSKSRSPLRENEDNYYHHNHGVADEGRGGLQGRYGDSPERYVEQVATSDHQPGLLTFQSDDDDDERLSTEKDTNARCVYRIRSPPLRDTSVSRESGSPCDDDRWKTAYESTLSTQQDAAIPGFSGDRRVRINNSWDEAEGSPEVYKYENYLEKPVDNQNDDDNNR